MPEAKQLEPSGKSHRKPKQVADESLDPKMLKDSNSAPLSAGGELDVRDLEPPQPMVRILSALEPMESGETMVALLSRKPIYLLPLLEESHHSYTISQRDADTWELRIIKG